MTEHTPTDKNAQTLSAAELAGLATRLFATINELQAELTEAREKNAALRDALVELMTWQNGPPLITYEEGWNAAMAKAEAALANEGGSP